MRKVYMRPTIEIEAYELSASIASNCSSVVTMGPEDYSGNICSEFEDSFDVQSYRPGISLFSAGTPFYDGTTGPVCDCYYTSGGSGYFTS